MKSESKALGKLYEIKRGRFRLDSTSRIKKIKSLLDLLTCSPFSIAGGTL